MIVRVKLMVKVTFKDGTVYEVSEPKGRHLRALPDLIETGDSKMTISYKLLSVLVTPALSFEDIDNLGAAEVVALLNALSTFQLDGLVG